MEANIVIRSLERAADFMIGKSCLGLVQGSLGEVKNLAGEESDLDL